MVNQLKKMDLHELNQAYQKVLIWFFSFPSREIGLNDLSHAVKISKTSAKEIVNKLEAEGFLKKEVIGRTWQISCDQNHAYNSSKKIAFNLAMIYESGILEKIKDIIPSQRAIILFGSYRKGDDDENSDIDIAVEVLDDKEVRIIELGIIPQIGYRKNIKVNLHLFSRNKVDINLFANIANGIVLQGFLEVKS